MRRMCKTDQILDLAGTTQEAIYVCAKLAIATYTFPLFQYRTRADIDIMIY